MRTIILSRSFILVFAMNFFYFTSLNLLNVIPPFLETLGASKFYIGLFMNLNSIVFVLMVVPLTRFTDIWGRKRLMITAYLLGIVSLALMFYFSENLWLLLIFKVLGSLIFCLTFTINGTEVFELLPREKRASGAALFGISGLIANPVASLAGEAIIHGPGEAWVFFASLCFLAAAIVPASFYAFHHPAQLPDKKAFFSFLGRPELRVLLILTLVFGGCFTIFASFLASLTKARLGIVQVSIFFSAFTLIAVAGRLFLANILDTWPRNILIAGCFSVIVLSLWGTAGLQFIWMLIPIGLLYGLGHSLLYPLLSSLFVNFGGEDDKLALNSVYSSVNTLGSFVWGLSLGVVGDVAGIGAIFIAMGLLAAAMVPVALWGLREGR